VKDFQEAKSYFIASWGELGINWGINRTMGHIHALLLISPKPLGADEIMNELKISRGNANMNLRALLDWGLIYRRSQAGERRDFFTAEKELWDVFKKTLEKRKTKELNPMLDMIRKISDVPSNDAESKEFNKLVKELDAISSAANKALDKIIESKSNLLLNTFLKVMR